jgi:GTP:adenosylcobinamide-phosphate guanylyltransferase
MDAIVTAGGIPLPGEPLYPATQGNSKALVDIAGKPMIQWVLDALDQAKTIDRVIIVGLTEKSGISCKKPVFYVSNQGKMVENLRAGAEKVLEVNKKAKYAIFVSSDIPAITGEMVDWVVNTAMETEDDVYYNVIQREAMEERFPGCKRTWTKLKDMEVCGGDMNVGRLGMVVDDDRDIWTKITDARKSPLKQAGMIGFGTAVSLLFGQLSLKKAEENIMNKLGITGRAIVCPYAEVGMDVDKMFQLEIMREDLEKRVKKEERAAKKTARPAAKKVMATSSARSTRRVKGKNAPVKKAPAKAAPKKPAAAPAKKTTKK